MKPLTRCPQCKYSLKGLPADHRCPECGFEYDAETAMWKGRLDGKDISAYVVAICTVIWIFLSRLFGTPFLPRSALRVALLLILGVLTLFVLYRVRQMRRAGDAVCTTRQGVWIKKGRRSELYLWDEIEDVFWNSTNRNAGMKTRGRTRPIYIAQVFRRLSKFEKFESEVRRRKQVAKEKSCSGS